MRGWQDTEYGKAPSDWKVLTLGEMSEKITDGAHQSPKPQEYGKYMCSVKDMTYDKFDFNGCKLISEEDYENLVKQGCKPKNGDILISKDGANCLDLIFVFRQDEELVLLSSIAIARLLPENVPEYVRYFLLSPDCQYTMRNNYVSGSAIPRVVLKDFKKIPILVPEHAEQKAIASVLSSLDDKIDLLHRQNKTLESMAETLFRQWFVEEAQEDWEDVKLGDFFPVITGKKDANFSTDDGEYPFFTCSQLPIKAPAYSFEGAAILLAGNGDFNVKRYIGKFEAYQRTYVLIPYDTNYFSFLFTLMRFYLPEITGGHQGSVINFITKGMITDFKLLLPANRELIVEKLMKFNRIYEKVDSNAQQIRTLEKLRDTLLPKLMSGEVRVAI